jgi:hypothetical protein
MFSYARGPTRFRCVAVSRCGRADTLDTDGNPRQHAGVAVMRVKEFYQWLIDLADALDGAPIDLPSAEHAFLSGHTVDQYLENQNAN